MCEYHLAAQALITLVSTFVLFFAVNTWKLYTKRTEPNHGKQLTDKIRPREQASNIQILEAANRKLVQQVRNLCSPGGLISKANAQFTALEVCQAQLRAMERLLKETQSKLIILEYGKAESQDRQRAASPSKRRQEDQG